MFTHVSKWCHGRRGAWRDKGSDAGHSRADGIDSVEAVWSTSMCGPSRCDVQGIPDKEILVAPVCCPHHE